MDASRARPLVLLLSLSLHVLVRAAMDSCYDEDGAPSRCMPKFENLAFNRTVRASNACGSPPEDYCMQTGSTRSCHQCNASDPEMSHGPGLLTDFHRNDEPTWWQSQSMFYGIQHPNSVNLTLHLGKAFEITYVRLKFYTSRPESFAIYKRTEESGPWLPYQYYSGSCGATYGKNPKGFLRPGDDERAAQCTDEFSDISPLSGGNVAFSTLEGRPSAYNFDQSLVLQEWVTATDLLISLDRINTFGDEFFKDAKVLRSYFYAISDFSVGGRCKCNGHASECVAGGGGGLVCSCQHHTEGADCQRCQPFYQDRPWARATGDSANQCLKCNCSGRSEECAFDASQYRSTGSGGRCLNCTGNTDGPHCERCRDNHHRKSPEEPCLPCDCDIDGSLSLQCDAEGRCACAAGVTGDKCDTCQPGFHSLGPGGCRPCDCSPAGTVDVCSPLDGRCRCKANAEGWSCDRCKPGFFNLQQSSPAGCQPCFCFGHSLACSSSARHSAVNITSDFGEDQDGWVGEFSGGQEYPLLWKEGEVYLLPLSEDDIGFYKAPEKFLGDHSRSYGQLFSITFTSETSELLPDHVALFLQGDAIALSADLSPLPPLADDPRLAPQRTFIVRLHETEARFQPQVSTFEFQRLLHNLTAVRISNAGGNNYTSQLTGVSLTSASIWDPAAAPTPAPAPWVESCSCPTGFAGQFCERCAPGFTWEEPARGPLSACVPCRCHQHGTCHPETGVCDCSDFTAGPTCERCLDGYHGNALIGTPADCRPCPCPGRSSCVELAAADGQVVCTDCPAGQTGMRCQMCEDGYHGDPLGRSGAVRPCVRCDCNGNADWNAVGICDRVTGRCLKCLGHTEGEHCQSCQRGFYGDALSQEPGPKCKSCSCSPAGSSGPAGECHPETGQCRCLPHVSGRDCSFCENGFFNLQRGVGCERCKCNPVGSLSAACHPITGQCMCRTGVEGRLCDFCRVGFFGFSSQGCRACNCDPMGSVSMQCHGNGTCHCRRGFVGYKCDKCELNYFHDRATHQCEECPVCYGLVKKQAEKLTTRLQDLEKLLSHFDCRGRKQQQQQHLLKYHLAWMYEHEHQGEDSLPNALEDFLAFQEAREAFIKRFSSLEASSGALLAHLHGITSTLNCSISMTQGAGEDEEEEEEEEEDKGSGAACRTLADATLMIRASQKQLQQATKDLDGMMIPFELVSGLNKWNTMVNESEVLMKRHKEAAERMEAVASRAAASSNRTLAFLTDLLQDNSTEAYIRNLTERISEMQQQKQELAEQVNVTSAQQQLLHQDAAAFKSALGNITSSLRQLTDSSPESNRTAERMEDLVNKTKQLDQQIQTKDDIINKTRQGTETVREAVNEKLKSLDGISELQARAQAAKASALSSVVAGKELESESISLHRELEDMAREWPHRQTQTRAAMKKERPLEEKVLAHVRRRVAEFEELIKPALENSTKARNISGEAEHMANAVAQESKAVLTQAKHTRTASGHLVADVSAALQQLSEHEALVAAAKSQLLSEPDVSLTGVREEMEAARLQLESYSVTLGDLIAKIDANVPLERFDRLLNETSRRLAVLRGSVQSPTLGAKMARLQSAAREQQSQLSLIERDVQDITAERDSLRDITLNLPRSCPPSQASGQG